LPGENDLDEDYYGQKSGETSWSPIRHWAVVGEIIDVGSLIRPRAQVETRYGERFVVHFHLDDASEPTFFKWKDLKPKSTLCTFYPYTRAFMDVSTGIRQENVGTIMVFPATLNQVSKEVHAHVRACQTPNQSCFHCGKHETASHKLKRCTRCKIAMYCDRDRCQRPHWESSHGKLCRHAEMLAGLARLNFSAFENHVDWSFAHKPPPSEEEREAFIRKTQREFFYKMGACVDPIPGRLGQLLDAIGDKTLRSDPIGRAVFGSQCGPYFRDDPLFDGPTRDTCLFVFLQDFLQSLAENPDKRSHVVDLAPPNSTDEMKNDFLLNTLFMSIPQWQHEASIGGISWAFEAHSVLNTEDAYPESMWEIQTEDGSIDSMMARNRKTGTFAFTSDSIALVAELGEAMAKNHPTCMVVRVLRPTANSSYTEVIRDIASKSSPDNLFTLWIREEVFMCGSFKPLRSDQSLIEQILDTREFDVIEAMLRRQGVLSQNMIRPTWNEDIGSSDESETYSENHRRCASCREYMTSDCFSKSQLRKPSGSSRCIECIENSRHCSSCRTNKSADHYSKNQLRKAPWLSRCKDCVKCR
jgi:hypothetical protein